MMWLKVQSNDLAPDLYFLDDFFMFALGVAYTHRIAVLAFADLGDLFRGF